MTQLSTFIAAYERLVAEGRVPDAVARVVRLTVCTGTDASGGRVADPCPSYHDERKGRGTGHCRACGCADWPVSQMHVQGNRLLTKLGWVPGRVWFPMGCPVGKFPAQDGRRKQRKEARCSITTTRPAGS